MTQNAKIATVIAVVLVLGGLGYYWYVNMMPKPVDTFVNTPATLPSGTDTSDQSLQTDTAAIDAEMKGLSSDQTSVDSSVTAAQ